ncbi:MAG: CDP-diacylglycerol--glycerol-3-phosphate 3-phosphatidyltransferase [Acidobacteria bacterium]|nr:CDP-diacylglycerol--glycerol-3-phosphate 3-phosphatidyltransferase [Acidobacteriota bacterium]
MAGREAERQRPATAALLRAGLNLPNALTLSRILIVPLLVVVLLTQIEGREFIGLGLFLVASLTDFLDGFLARRRKEVTALGKLLDPAADKILTSAAFISLVGLGLAPAWMVVVVIAREFAVSSLRSLAAAQDVVLAASLAGKVKTVTQIVAISLLIISDQLGAFDVLAPLSLWVALAATLYSGIEYFVRNGRRVLEAFGAASPEQ